MVVAAQRSSLTALSLLRRKFEDLGNRCPEPLYAFVTAVDTPSPVATEFEALPPYLFSILREPHAPSTSLHPGLAVVRTGATVILSREGSGRLRSKDDDSRTYTVGVLRRQDEHWATAIKKQLHLARAQGHEQAVQQFERDLSFAPRCPDLDSWLREYEVLAGRAWDCLPPEIRGMRSEFYAYPGMLCFAAWSWTQLQFLLAWSGGERHGLTAPRCVVNRGGVCDAEAFLRKVAADSKDAGRGSPKADRAVLAARDELRRSNGLWPSFESDLRHPLACCRAMMELTLCDGAVLAIDELCRRQPGGEGASGSGMEANGTWPCRFQRSGTRWRMAFEGEEGHPPHRMGFLDIQALLASPNHWTGALALSGADKAISSDRVSAGHTYTAGLQESSLAGTRYEVVDQQSMRESAEQLADLQEALTTERGHYTEEELVSLESKRDKLAACMEMSTGKRGRSRTLDIGNVPKRAAKRVRKRIDESIETIRKEGTLGRLADHLWASIRWEGASVIYSPGQQYSWEL